MYLTETKSYKWKEGDGEEEGGEKVRLLTHATARGMGKKQLSVCTQTTLLILSESGDNKL